MRGLARLLLWLVVACALAVGARAQGAVLVVGGGELPPTALAWFAGHARGDSVLVVGYHDAPSARVVAGLRAAGASVAWLRVADTTVADDPAVAARVRAAGALFFPGGDQNRYTTAWSRRAVARAAVEAWRGGTAVGGTSAGAMILGETAFPATLDGVTARDAVADPFADALALAPGAVPLLAGVLVETHVAERGRLGRMAAFLARHRRESERIAAFLGLSWGTPSHRRDPGRWTAVLGVDDATALAVEPDGTRGTVHGTGVATWLAATDDTEVQDRAPLGIGPLRIAQVAAGGTLDVAIGYADLGSSAAPFSPALPSWPTARTRLVGSLPGVAVVAGGWGDPATEEARVAGLAEAAVRERASLAVLVPDGAVVWAIGGALHVKGGRTPALVLDLRGTRAVRVAGVLAARVNGAFEGVLWMVPPGGTWAP